MKYKGFFVIITLNKNLSREDKNDDIIACDGFIIEFYSDVSEKLKIDVFSAGADFELLNNILEEAVQFAKDYIDSEEKEYQRMIDEYGREIENNNRM